MAAAYSSLEKNQLTFRQQRVEWRDDGIYLTGWAEVVFDGHWVSSLADLPF